MKRTFVALVMAGSPVISGCRVMAHLTEHVEVERRRVISEEPLGETWTGAKTASLVAALETRELLLTGESVEHGMRKVRQRYESTVETQCARRAVGGIFEAPDSFWGVCADVWIGFAFLGWFLFHHADANDWRVSAVFFALGLAPFLIDVLTFIPMWIAGHDWAGPCDWHGGSTGEGEHTEEIETPVERRAPLAGAILTARQDGREVARILPTPLDADGRARVSLADVARASLGNGANLVFEVESDGKRTTTSVSPGSVLNGPGGTSVDWRAPAGGTAPNLVVTTHVVDHTLYITFENVGFGDAWQVAAIVASSTPSLDRCVAAVGRVHPGEVVEARISLPEGAEAGALDFTEAFGHAPVAMPFGGR